MTKRHVDYNSSSLIHHLPSSGFTLIEMIVVMLIIGIASGLVGMLISKGSDNLELRTFTREVASALRYARNHAVSEKNIYCFVIDPEKREYVLFSEDTGYTKIDIVMNIPIPDKLEMVQDKESIEFFPRGNSTGGKIEISSREESSYIIRINRITGKVEAEKAEL